MKLPRTNFETNADNPVGHLFRGRLDIYQANAFMYFRKKGLAQQLMHELKYNGNREMGIFLGELFGRQIKGTMQPLKPDLMTTVPLHKQKLSKRGFNQSDEIAKGFAREIDVPFVPGILERTRYTDTQTKKKRYERWENTEGSFVVGNQQSIEGKHIGIMDDVITTGATLESCGQQLLQVSGVRLSIFSLCMAIH